MAIIARKLNLEFIRGEMGEEACKLLLSLEAAVGRLMVLGQEAEDHAAKPGFNFDNYNQRLGIAQQQVGLIHAALLDIEQEIDIQEISENGS